MLPKKKKIITNIILLVRFVRNLKKCDELKYEIKIIKVGM